MYRYILTLAVLGLFLSGCQTDGPPLEPDLGAPTPSASSDSISAPLPAISAPSSQSSMGAGATSSAMTGELALSSDQRFSDVPLPVKAKQDLEHSYIYEDATLQVGKAVYTSHATMAELTNFYVKECPAGDWQLEQRLDTDRVTMFFAKPGKRLVVTIERKKGLIPYRLLTLNLTPSAGTKALP